MGLLVNYNQYDFMRKPRSSIFKNKTVTRPMVLECEVYRPSDLKLWKWMTQ